MTIMLQFTRLALNFQTILNHSFTCTIHFVVAFHERSRSFQKNNIFVEMIKGVSQAAENNVTDTGAFLSV